MESTDRFWGFQLIADDKLKKISLTNCMVIKTFPPPQIKTEKRSGHVRLAFYLVEYFFTS